MDEATKAAMAEAEMIRWALSHGLEIQDLSDEAEEG